MSVAQSAVNLEQNNDITANLPQQPNTSPGRRIGTFPQTPGAAYGFSDAVQQEYASNFFYQNSAFPNDTGVPPDMLNTKLYRSIFNKFALFNYRGMYGGLSGDIKSQYFDDKMLQNAINGNVAGSKAPTLSSIINFFDQNYPKIGYRREDFLYHKFYNKIPPNYLITLRRFPMPVMDNIFKFEADTSEAKDGSNIEDITMIAGVTACTYLGESAGNPLNSLLNMSFGLTWKEITAQMETLSGGSGGGSGYNNQGFYSKLGGGGKAFVDRLKGVSPGTKFRRTRGAGGSAQDPYGTTYANFVLGPVNVVNKTNTRDRGINFDNAVSLKFDYDLKSLGYVNPKIAMIDLISNMLTMCTNNGQFYGGGHRYFGGGGGGGAAGSAFGDMSKLRQGDFGGYIASVTDDVSSGLRNVFGNGSGGFDVESLLKGAMSVGQQFLGNALGGFLGENFGMGGGSGPQAAKAVISGEPTGDWHVTVGNPLNPIVMMGNMLCEKGAMSFGGGLGYDDFPMEVSFQIDMKHGKPRDKGDIENMFNAGQGRIYAPARDEKDILNLSGIEVAAYGVASDVGTQNTQPTQGGGVTANANAGKPSDAGNAQVTNAKSGSANNGSDNPPDNITIGERFGNYVEMFIGS